MVRLVNRQRPGRAVEVVSRGVVVIDDKTVYPSPPDGSGLLRHILEGDAKFSCRALVLDLTTATTISKAVQLLTELQVDVQPATLMVALGFSRLAQPLLNNSILTNTVHTLYLAHHNSTSITLPDGGTADTTAGEEQATQAEVLVYSRCHYCNHGEARLLVLDRWSLRRGGFHDGTNLFLGEFEQHKDNAYGIPTDQFKDCMGHKFHVVSMDWFPFLKFHRDSQAPATAVTPLDSLDIRMLDSIASILNFTYEIRTPWDNQWGVHQDNGNWTGTVGTLQHQQADFSMLLNWSKERKNVIDFSRIYAAEPLVMVTSKPRPLPKYLSIINPFTGGVWIVVVVMGMWGCLVYWGLQKVRRHLPGGQDMNCGSALFYITGLLLEDPPFRLPTNITGQVLVGWFCLFGLLVASMYRCSLVAHLSVPRRAAPVETFDQLLAQNGWSWGLEPTYGAEWEWFQNSVSTTIRNIFQGIQILDLKIHLAQILDHGNHALLTWKYHIQTVVASHYTDFRGYTPLHIGRTEYFISTGYGWGFRKGAPFLPHLDKTKQRLVETGHISHWLKDLIQTSARTARREKTEKKKHLQEEEEEGESKELEVVQVEGARTVLSMEHLLGAFLFLALGCCVALFTLLGEGALVTLTSWKHSPLEHGVQ
ncbi:glutamate receptor ionotropic, kainate glr-3-like [Panulirus ornatus]|uniref:glutamate receptor ionotropic, kainate glr-3-like n=1 Tax=Panulirus ornatus TaxID=150431 RepID=UPI003A83C725